MSPLFTADPAVGFEVLVAVKMTGTVVFASAECCTRFVAFFGSAATLPGSPGYVSQAS